MSINQLSNLFDSSFEDMSITEIRVSKVSNELTPTVTLQGHLPMSFDEDSHSRSEQPSIESIDTLVKSLILYVALHFSSFMNENF